MATEAERLLKGSGWLPEVLRRHDLAALDGVEGQGAFEPVSDMLTADRDVIGKLEMAKAAEYAEANAPWPVNEECN